MAFQRVPQMEPTVEPIMILATHALTFEVTAPFEFDHDTLYSSLCNQHLHRNVANAYVGRCIDAMEDVSMVAQKCPDRMRNLLRHVGRFV